jgi:hypothetical protein
MLSALYSVGLLADIEAYCAINTIWHCNWQIIVIDVNREDQLVKVKPVMQIRLLYVYLLHAKQ